MMIKLLVDVDITDALDQIDESILVSYLEGEGYNVSENYTEDSDFTREELDYILSKIDDDFPNWEGRRVYDKVHNMRFG